MPTSIFIPNRRVHLRNKLPKKTFLQKIENVRGVRKGSGAIGAGWYPRHANDWSRWDAWGELIHKGNFENIQQDLIPFAVGLPEEIYLLIRNNSLEIIKNQIICWIASTLAEFQNGKKFLQAKGTEPSLLPHLLPVVTDLHQKYFGGKCYEKTPAGWDEKEWDEKESMRDEFEKLREQMFQEICNGSPAKFLIESSPAIHWFTYEIYFWREDDWERIILKDSPDPLMRAESDEAAWAKWLVDYQTRGENETGPTKPDLSPQTPGWVYIIQAGTSNLYKIGWTQNVEARLKCLQTGSAEKLTVVRKFPASNPHVEKAIHKIHDKDRRSGEWFELRASIALSLGTKEWNAAHHIL